MGRLSGKRCLVTGAGAPGLGRACAAAFAAEGARVAICDEAESGDVAPIEGASFHAADPLSEGDWADVAARAKAELGGLDALVTAQGVEIRGALTDLGFDDFKRAMDLNVVAAFLAMKAAIPVMREGGGGAVVNLASSLALAPEADYFAGAAAAGGVQLLTKSVALECARGKTGVRVNSLHVGPVAGDARRAAFAGGPHPLGAPVAFADAAEAAVYLISDAASFVTGMELAVDGGRSAGIVAEGALS